MKLEKFISFFDKKLSDHLCGICSYTPFCEIISYTPLVGGKRLRPYLIWELSRLTSFGSDRALKTGIAVELFHSGSLIHDDLPPIDNDDFRRGKPSNHSIFGEARAILAGDYLMLYPSKVISSLDLDHRYKERLMNLWSDVSLQVVEGEFADVAPSERTEELLSFIRRGKTASLFGFCFAAPFCVDDGSKFSEMFELGVDFGEIFQMMDDIKDATSTLQELGKTPGKDLSQDKLTLLSFRSVEQAEAMVEKRFYAFCEKITEYRDLAGELEDIFRLIARR